MSERGAGYVAKVRLSDKANNTLAMPGQTCERVPDVSLEPLLASGKIERKADAPAATKRAPAPSHRRMKDDDEGGA